MRTHPLSWPLLAAACLLSSCITQHPALPDQAKLRAPPQDFNRPGPFILVNKVDGQEPAFDKRDYSTILTAGPHVIELETKNSSYGPQPGELIAFLAKKFAPPPPPPPQLEHRFTAELGHDYLYRWALQMDNHQEFIWIEDHTRGGQVVSGQRPPDAPKLKDPFKK